ncbi:hypothetical protein [Pseudooceanicola sp. 200-1SW]|uniref:hypothetical protein n=1 Tax=Pseudooceanicola sp. 200-1SW TaxID=3425949 RepID=UPI003D7FA8B6
MPKLPRPAPTRALRAAALPALALLAASAAAPARAQLVLDGTLRLELAHNEDTSINTKRFRGSFDGLVWNDIGVQLDLGVGKHEHHESTQPSATLHGYYRVDETLSYGLFLAAEDRRPGNSYFYGAEVAYQGEALGIEAFAAYRDDIAESTDGGRYGLDVTYALPAAPRWTLLAGAVTDNGAPVDQGFGYLGATYEVRDGIDIGMTAGSTEDGAAIASVLATFTFGRGATFRARDTMELYPGY